jgi:hypothetical protein
LANILIASAAGLKLRCCEVDRYYRIYVRFTHSRRGVTAYLALISFFARIHLPIPFPTKGFRVDWKHPVTLSIVGTVGGAIIAAAFGWLGGALLTYWTPGGIDVTLAHPTEVMALSEPHRARFEGIPIYCDTLNASLELSHSLSGTAPALIDQIRFRYIKLTGDDAPAHDMCHLDHLSGHPYGIEPRETFIITMTDTAPSARFIKSEKPGQAWLIPIDNILNKKDQHISISLNSTSAPVSFDVPVNTRSKFSYKIWFDIYYNAGGLSY